MCREERLLKKRQAEKKRRECILKDPQLKKDEAEKRKRRDARNKKNDKSRKKSKREITIQRNK